MQPIQLKFSPKQTVFQFFFSFLKSILNFKHFSKKDEVDVFPEIPAPKNMVREMSKKPSLSLPLEREYGKKQMTFIADVFPELPAPKNMVK